MILSWVQIVNCKTIDFSLPNHAAESQLYAEVLAEVWSGLIDIYYKQLYMFNTRRQVS